MSTTTHNTHTFRRPRSALNVALRMLAVVAFLLFLSLAVFGTLGASFGVFIATGITILHGSWPTANFIGFGLYLGGIAAILFLIAFFRDEGDDFMEMCRDPFLPLRDVLFKW